MVQKNGRLAAVVAAVAVAAVAGGGAFAYQQSPRAGGTAAVPLLAPSSRPTPSVTPSVTQSPATPAPTPGPILKPSVPPSTTPVPSKPVSNPVEIPVDLTRLANGRGTDVTYLAGREVRGGGPTVKVPGSQRIGRVARLGDDVLAVVGTEGVNDELLRIGAGHPTKHTPDVDTLVTNKQRTAAAYSTVRLDGNGIRTRGGDIHYLPATGAPKVLPLGDTFGLRLVALQDGKVYYRTADNPETDDESLYAWTPGTTTPKLIKTVTTRLLSKDSRYATGAPVYGSKGNCTTMRAFATGKRLWENCDSDLITFTPDGNVTLGRGTVGNTPMVRITAQDTKTGKLIHAWTGFFANVGAEDDQHLLISTEGATGGSLIRCEIASGNCEYAVAPSSTDLRLFQGPNI